jgi:hypothetical protein
VTAVTSPRGSCYELVCPDSTSMKGSLAGLAMMPGNQAHEYA